MRNERKCWGVFRERAHSPGREFDDSEIFRLTAKHLVEKGFQVSLKAEEELDSSIAGYPSCLFLMCESIAVLPRLLEGERLGKRLINSPVAIWNTYRNRMIPLFQQNGIPLPQSALVATQEHGISLSGPTWIKRGDIHNTQEGDDVVYVETESAAYEALSRLAGRGIPSALVQEHVPGDLIKFYGIGRSAGLNDQPGWFRSFYHRDQQVVGHAFEQAALASLAHRAAQILGLEIYGGDAIATSRGQLLLIDLNAWPSFALFREEASVHIASYLAHRFERS